MIGKSPRCLTLLGGCSLFAAICLTLVGCEATKVSVGSMRKVARPPGVRNSETEAFFRDRPVSTCRIVISEGQLGRLREDPRRYVRCQLIVDDRQEFQEVAIKLKGAAGSFQEIDQKPAFTVNMDKFRKGQSFQGMTKWHLNNSVQDESYLSEKLCADICNSAGIPTPQVTHARVWLNERDLGLYVLKEGFDPKFLSAAFERGDGNLYDGGFLQDIDGELEKDAGHGPGDGSDLRALLAACQDVDPSRRWLRMEELLDVPAFIRFMAFELMACHWDGYTLNKNNYRIYFLPSNGKAYFLPHGMDQMFGDAGMPVLEYPPSIVADAVMQNPGWRALYRQELITMLPFFETRRLQDRIDSWQSRLSDRIHSMGPDFTQQQAERAAALKEQVAARYSNLCEQIALPEPGPLVFDDSPRIALDGWYPNYETDGITFEELELDGRICYQIRVEQPGEAGEDENTDKESGQNDEEWDNDEEDDGERVGSWRRRVLLPAGDYIFEARIRCEQVVACEHPQGTGVGLRISGATRQNQLAGDCDWQLVQFPFQVLEEQRSVELVVELRARSGKMWIETPPVLVRLQANGVE